MLDIDTINAMDRETFVARLGPVFENSPWVAARAWEKRPFADGAALHAAMVAEILSSDMPAQVDFLRAHPDLAGKEARQGRMTAESTAEQGTAGLGSLTSAELAHIDGLNARYRASHGFPFIICARHYTKAGIFAEFGHRVERETPVEFAEAMRQIGHISRYRLGALMAA